MNVDKKAVGAKDRVGKGDGVQATKKGRRIEAIVLIMVYTGVRISACFVSIAYYWKGICIKKMSFMYTQHSRNFQLLL